MDWVNSWVFLTSIFVLFCLNTVLQFRLGFKQGTSGGYSVGMLHAVKYLMKNEALEIENKTTGISATPAEVVVYIMDKASYLGMTEDEAKFIAAARVEKEKS